MSRARRARRSDKRRILVAAIAAAAVASGAAAATAMAGQGSGPAAEASAPAAACKVVQPKSQDQTTWVGFPQVAEVLKEAGAKQETLDRLNASLRALPSNDIVLKVRGLLGSSGAAPKTEVKTLQGRSPQEYVRANAAVTMADVKRPQAEVNKVLAEVWSQTGGRDGILSALFSRMLGANVDLDIENLEVGNLKLNVGGLELESEDLKVDQVDLQLDSSSENIRFALESTGDCDAPGKAK